jgi:type IV pilus assembly protein PilW
VSRQPWRSRPAASSGMTLVELMVAMLLGLIVTGAAVSVLLSNKQSYRTNEALSQIQESARTAFELLARDVRQTGINGCDNKARVANVLPAASWWDSWFVIHGYDGSTSDPAVVFGTAVGERVAGTDSLQLQGAEGTELSIVSHDAAAASFAINAAASDFVVNDILIVCDFDHAAMFQASSYDGAAMTLAHDVGGATPGNCSQGLGFPTNCATSTGNVYAFPPNSLISRLGATAWYIGNNGRPAEGGRSLYRRRLGNGATLVSEEVVAGVTDMRVSYRLAGASAFQAAGLLGAGDWSNVDAIAIALTVDSTDRRVSTDAAVNAGRLQRTFSNVITLRNRVP